MAEEYEGDRDRRQGDSRRLGIEMRRRKRRVDADEWKTLEKRRGRERRGGADQRKSERRVK